MARGKREIPPSSKRYGLPLYCADWVPLAKISTKEQQQEEEEGGERSEEEWMMVLGGGGGEGRSGVPNALLISSFDPISRSLADEPVHRFGTEGEVPYRMATHPAGDGILCSFPKSCRWFEWNLMESDGGTKLGLISSERSLTQLEDVGLQLAMAFSADGSFLATGGEDGYLRVFKWPSMDLIIDQSGAHVSVKDLDFSPDGKFLVSVGSSGPCRVWDTSSCSAVASLAIKNGESFRFCRFCKSIDNSQILYVTAMQGEKGGVISWDTVSWNRIGSKQITRDPISAFNVSRDGKYLAVGTIEGDIFIANCKNTQVLTVVKKAHVGIITTLVFRESSALLSTSFDASTRVTVIDGKKKSGINIWAIIFVILLAVLVYYMKTAQSF